MPYRSLTSPTATCRSMWREPVGPVVALSLDQIAADLHNPSSPVAQASDGSANYLIAVLCAVVGQGAAPICA